LDALQRISVEGAHLDHRPVAEDELAQAVWQRIEGFCR
jgi:hypothetical protein